MKLLINISEYDKEWIQNAYEIPREINIDIAKAIINSEPYKPERKKGRWLPDSNSVYEVRFICSECKKSEVVPTIGFTKYEPLWDFCPNCGADMRQREEQE